MYTDTNTHTHSAHTFSLDAGGGWKLCVPRNHHVSFDARGLVLAALVVGGAAVVAISAAHGLRRSEREEVLLSHHRTCFPVPL